MTSPVASSSLYTPSKITNFLFLIEKRKFQTRCMAGMLRLTPLLLFSTCAHKCGPWGSRVLCRQLQVQECEPTAEQMKDFKGHHNSHKKGTLLLQTTPLRAEKNMLPRLSEWKSEQRYLECGQEMWRERELREK